MLPSKWHLLAWIALLPFLSFSQGQVKSIQMNGIILNQSTNEYLPNAYILNERAGRGAISDNLGNFSMDVYPGDSLLFSYVGFAKKYYIVPQERNLAFSTIIFLSENVTRLQEVKVYPYATEEAFKKAFLERELADALQRQRLRKNLEQSGLNTLAMQMATSSNRNFLNYSDLLTYSQANRNNVQTISTALGNPFAWASFIKDLKKSSQTKKIWEKRFNEAPNENISREKYLKEIPKN